VSELKVEASAQTPHTEALYEAGKKLLVDSIEVGREFCKFMVGVSNGAIPLYLALVGLAVGKNYRPTLIEGIFLLAPPAVFLIAASVFAAGYFPVHSNFSLELLHEIEAARLAIVKRRYTSASWGFTLFVIAVMLSVAAVTYALSTGSPSTPGGQ
jgi:hypothetical protein